jgi:hypothetical protein
MRLGMPLLALKIASKASAENRWKRGGSGQLQAVFDIGLGFDDIERANVAGGNHSLAKLHHVRALQNLPEFRLANQEALQQGLVAVLEIGEHAQFFHCPGGQILRFIDDQQAALALGGHADQEGFERHQDVGFGDILGAQAKCGAHQAQGVVGIELRADQLGGDDFLGIQTLKQAPHDGRFSSAHFTGNDDKAFILVHAVFKIGLGSAVLLAPEIEVGVRVELERLAGQAVIGFVHNLENYRDASDEGILGVGIC